jgi:hypothetical protein
VLALSATSPYGPAVTASDVPPTPSSSAPADLTVELAVALALDDDLALDADLQVGLDVAGNDPDLEVLRARSAPCVRT